MSNDNLVSVTSFALFLPEKKLSSTDLAEQSDVRKDFIEDFLGIQYIYMPGARDHAANMAVRAARTALRKAAMEPQQIDLILYVGSSYTEYPNWVASLKIQKDLQASNAIAFDINQSCTGLMAGFRVARAMMHSDTGINRVLLAGGQRTTDHVDYTNPLTQFLLNTSAGGGAIILERGRKGIASLLETCLLTDGRACEDIVVPVGGSKTPLPDGTVEHTATMTVQDPAQLNHSVADQLIEKTIYCIKQSIEKSGRTIGDLSFLIFHHARIDHHLQVLEALDLSEDQTVSLEEFGHIGSLDSITALQLAQEKRLLKHGDLIVCAGAGMGYSWAATTLEWF